MISSAIIGLGKKSIVPVTLPQSVKKLLQDKAYEHVVTFDSQGRPQLTMV